MHRLLGILFGVVVAVVVVAGMDWLTNWLFPIVIPDANVPSIESASEATPLTAKVLIVGGWFLGALAGGLAAVWISSWQAAVWVVSALFAAAALTNMLLIQNPQWMQIAGADVVLIPHPLWMQIAGVVAPLCAAFVAKGAA